jgi:hypothetical protein
MLPEGRSDWFVGEERPHRAGEVGNDVLAGDDVLAGQADGAGLPLLVANSICKVQMN